jgi:tetratricopeptide (TPR) repeat protein
MDSPIQIPVGTIIQAVVILLFTLSIIGWLVWRALRKSDEPLRLAWKGGVTLMLVWWWLWVVAPMAAKGGFSALFALLMSLPIFIVLGLIWAPNLADWVAKPLSGLYDGGDEEVEARPVYSMAEAMIRQGRHAQAAAEIRKQLLMFPKDMQGRFMLAELQAGHLRDLDGGEQTLRMLLSEPGLSPGSIAAALNLLADLHLQHARNPDAAREALEEIIHALPDTPQAQNAAERISHLPTAGDMEARDQPRTLELKPGVHDLGLKKVELADSAILLDQRMNTLLDQLQRFPADSESREQLIRLLSEEKNDLESARIQVGLALGVPHQTAKQLARWLQLQATVEIRCGRNLEAARGALQRIIDQFPLTALAETAQQRIESLATELKGMDERREVAMGIYEKDLGLKQRSS